MLLTRLGKDVVSTTKRLQFAKKRKLCMSSLAEPQNHSIEEQVKANAKSANELLIKSNDSGIARISFSNHTVFNGALYRAISSLHEWRNGKGLILSSSDCNFKNNRSINEIITGDAMQEMLHKLQELVHSIQTIPLISVYLLNGKSSGIGTDLFLSTDFRILTSCSEVNFDHVKFGLPPLAGGVELLKNVVGERECLKMLLGRGMRLNSKEAMDLGLADKVLSNEKNVDGLGRKPGWSTEEQVKSAENWLRDLLGRTNEDASIVQAVKRILVSTRDGSGGRSRKLDVESREILSCLHGQPHLTAMGVCSEPMLTHLRPSNSTS